MPDMLTTQEAADRMHVTRARILQLIRTQQLRAMRFGNQWQLDAADVAAFQRQPPGRRWPRKQEGKE